MLSLLLVSVASAIDKQRPNRLVLASRSMGKARSGHQVLAAQQPTSDRSVTGMCSAAQDSIGSVREAVSAGISTLAQCAQYGKDRSDTANFVSFSASLSTCMWFKDCHCLVSSSTCLGGDQWSSVAIIDIVTGSSSSDAVVETTAAPIAKSAVISGPQGSDTQSSSSGNSPDCDTVYSSSLMQSFQTKCQMDQTVWTTRLIAGSTLVGVILVVASVFGLAYFFDQQELKGLMTK